MNVCMNVCMDVCMYVYIYTHTNTFISEFTKYAKTMCVQVLWPGHLCTNLSRCHVDICLPNGELYPSRVLRYTVYIDRQSVADIQAQIQTESMSECEREREGGIDGDLCRCHFLEGVVGPGA